MMLVQRPTLIHILGLQGCLQQVNVSVLNGHIEISSIEFTIESLDGKSKLNITAFTAEKVTGDLKAIGWSTFSREWPHLQNLLCFGLSNLIRFLILLRNLLAGL